MIEKILKLFKGTSDEEIEECFHASHNEAYDKICNDNEGEFSIIVKRDVIKMYEDSYKNQTTWVKCKENGDIEKAYIVAGIDLVYDENNSKHIKTKMYEVTFVRIELPINLKNIFVVNAWEDKWNSYHYIVEKYNDNKGSD